MISTRDAFTPLREALEAASVRYAVGGSWASTAFGEPRFTNDVDILVDFSDETLTQFLGTLSTEFYADLEEAQAALERGLPFNVIYMPLAFKFDFFPAAAFPLGMEELERATAISNTGLSAEAVPFVTPEDILLAKLHWFKLGGETSEVQWRDLNGIIRTRGAALDRDYLERGAAKLGISDLLQNLF